MLRKPLHLRFDYIGAYHSDVRGHAQDVMRTLGITYRWSTPQSMGDQWWFWHCSGAPDILPDYLTELTLDPMGCIGWGLDQKTAEAIRDYAT